MNRSATAGKERVERCWCAWTDERCVESEETTFRRGEVGGLSMGADAERRFWPSMEDGLRRMKVETALRGEIIMKERGLLVVADTVDAVSDVTTIV